MLLKLCEFFHPYMGKHQDFASCASLFIIRFSSFIDVLLIQLVSSIKRVYFYFKFGISHIWCDLISTNLQMKKLVLDLHLNRSLGKHSLGMKRHCNFTRKHNNKDFRLKISKYKKRREICSSGLLLPPYRKAKIRNIWSN